MFNFIGKCVVYGLAAYGAVRFSNYAAKRGADGVRSDIRDTWNQFKAWATETDVEVHTPKSDKNKTSKNATK